MRPQPIDYEADIPGWNSAHSAQRIIELSQANKRLADRVELWQWIAFAAMGIATIALNLLFIVIAWPW